MKKLMLIAAGIVLAAVTQAAQIDWGVAVSSWSFPAGSTTSKLGVDFYLINAANQAAIIAAINGGTFGALGAADGVLNVKATTTTKGYIATASSGNVATLTAGQTYNFAVLFFDTVGGTDYYRISGASNKAAYDPADPVYFEASSVVYTATEFAGGTGWTQIVPEPTSMALLALGAAVVGLRRKFRA